MCTGITIKSTNGHYYWGRTQEFNLKLDYDGIIIPRNFDVNLAISSFPTKYAAVGVAAMGMPGLIDGVNEKGLMGGSFYFGNYNRYADEKAIRDAGKLPLCGAEFVTYALTRYGSVAEMKENANKDTAIALNDGPTGFPQHYVFQDETGASIAVEPSIEGGYEIYDNPVGIFTNSPKFDWHLTNLQNYVGLHDTIDKDIQMGDLNVFTNGKGSGLRGVPGDFTPQSRFIRSAFLKQFANPVDDEKSVDLIFHILDSFDIPKGVVKVTSDEDIQYTQYTSAYDAKEKKMYIHTYDNRMIQTLSLSDGDIDSKDAQFFSLTPEQQYLPMTKK